MTKQLLVPEQLVNLAAAPAAVGTSILFVQKAPIAYFGASGAGPISQTFSTAVTVGNILIVGTQTNDSGGSVVSGGGVASWVRVQFCQINGTSGELWYGIVTTPGQTVVTCTAAGGNVYPNLTASEWSGIATSGTVSSSGQNPVANVTNPQAGVPLFVSPGQLYVASFQCASGYLQVPPGSPGVGWVNLGYFAFTSGSGNAYDQTDYLLNPAIAATYTPSYGLNSTGNPGQPTGVIFNPGTTSTSAQPGQMYYDTVLQQVGIYTGTTYGWQYIESNSDAMQWMGVKP